MGAGDNGAVWGCLKRDSGPLGHRARLADPDGNRVVVMSWINWLELWAVWKTGSGPLEMPSALEFNDSVLSVTLAQGRDFEEAGGVIHDSRRL